MSNFFRKTKGAQVKAFRETIPRNSITDSTLDTQLAKRSLEFFPISSHNIKRHIPADSESLSDSINLQTAGEAAMKQFLEMEMRMQKTLSDKLQLSQIFYAREGSGSQTLFAELTSES